MASKSLTSRWLRIFNKKVNKMIASLTTMYQRQKITNAWQMLTKKMMSVFQKIVVRMLILMSQKCLKLMSMKFLLITRKAMVKEKDLEEKREDILSN